MNTKALYHSTKSVKRVEIGDQVRVGGDLAHVVQLGRKYVQVLFYADQSTSGRMRIDPLSDLIQWTGTQHN